MLSKRKPKLTWAPPAMGNVTVVERLMLGPWSLCEITNRGDPGYAIATRFPITKDAAGNSLSHHSWAQTHKSLEKAKEQAEKQTLVFLKAVGLDPVVTFPDKTYRAPKPPMAPTGIRRLEV